MSVIQCPHCNGTVDGSGLSGTVICPYCQQQFIIDGVATPAAKDDYYEEEEYYEEETDGASVGSIVIISTLVVVILAAVGVGIWMYATGRIGKPPETPEEALKRQLIQDSSDMARKTLKRYGYSNTKLKTVKLMKDGLIAVTGDANDKEGVPRVVELRFLRKEFSERVTWTLELFQADDKIVHAPAVKRKQDD